MSSPSHDGNVGLAVKNLDFVTFVTSIPRVCHYQESEWARVHGTAFECIKVHEDSVVPAPHPVSDPFMTEKPARQSVKRY